MDDDTTDLDIEPELPQLPVTPVTEQHPALSGDEAGAQAEIDHRTADPVATGNGRFGRVFTVGQVGLGPDHPVHRMNAAETLGDAIRRGLHPKGDVHLIGAVETDRPRERHTVLTYEVEVVPAVIDRDAASTVSARDVTGV